MKIAEVVENVDIMKPNQFDARTKVDWVITIEGQIWDEIILTHEDAPEEAFDACAANGESELIARPPYSDVYRFYLEAQIDLANGEVDRYNNSIEMFNAAWTAFRNHYNRKHMPISRVKSLGFTNRRRCNYGPIA